MTQTLTISERRALLDAMKARPDAPAGIHLIDVREPTERERAYGLSLIDFAARRKEIWRDRVFSAEEVKRMRDAEDSEE